MVHCTIYSTTITEFTLEKKRPFNYNNPKNLEILVHLVQSTQMGIGIQSSLKVALPHPSNLLSN